MEWHSFDKGRGSRQQLPPERKEVLVRVLSTRLGIPDALYVGYLRLAAGDKDSPQFIIPGVANAPGHLAIVVQWCDCLPTGFVWPHMADEGSASV